MEIDDPNIPEFASINSFANFRRNVRNSNRYFLSESDMAFLKTLGATAHNREYVLKKGQVYFRAQKGIKYLEDEHGGEWEVGFRKNRMIPTREHAGHGRVSPAGIRTLYLGTSVETAISEMRQWIGSEISVARFKLKKDIRAIDLSKLHGKKNNAFFREFATGEKSDAIEKENAIWIDVDNAFSKPMSDDDGKLGYIPTQIIAEFFRTLGFEAIIYKSNFGAEKGYNIALFCPEDADFVDCGPYEISELTIKFKELGPHR